MGLVDKLEGFYDKAKRLALVGILGGGLGGIALNSGCVAHGSPQEVSNFVFRDVMGFPGIKEKSNNGRPAYEGTEKRIPGIVIVSVIDENGNGRADKEENIDNTRDKYFFNNDILFIHANKNKYGNHLLKFVLRDDKNNAIVYNNSKFIYKPQKENENFMELVAPFNAPCYKKSLTEQGFGQLANGSMRYIIEFFKDDEMLPSDSKSFIIDFDKSYQ